MKHPVIATLILSIAAASHSAEEEVRQHDAHAHGIGELNIAVENNELLIELISPAINIVGFEHQPENAEQKQQISDAIKRLEQAGELFITSQDALCQIEHVHVESTILDEHDGHDQDDEEHGHKDDEEHGHGDDEEHGHKDDEEHGHGDDDDHGHEADSHQEIHSDFTAEYEFHCDKPEKLVEINVKLFEAFPLTEKLNAQVLSLSGQSAKTLTKENTILDL